MTEHEKIEFSKSQKKKHTKDVFASLAERFQEGKKDSLTPHLRNSFQEEHKECAKFVSNNCLLLEEIFTSLKFHLAACSLLENILRCKEVQRLEKSSSSILGCFSN